MDRKRYPLLDFLRGLALINMIGFHLCWNLKNLCHLNMPWFGTLYTHIWQRLICCSFILLSGFCLHLSSKPIKRGAIVFAAGMAVSGVTLMMVPEGRIIFGILTFLGSAMIIIGSLRPVLDKLPPLYGVIIGLSLFALTYHINRGYLAGLPLPNQLYQGYVATYLGFMSKDFYSADYFSLMPWIFLFISGYYLYPCVNMEKLPKPYLKPLNLLGRHSLIIYLIHQPVIYLTMMIIGAV